MSSGTGGASPEPTPRPAGAPPARAGWGLLLWLGSLAAVVAAALALPVWPAPLDPDRRLRVILIDVSDSVVRARPDWLPWVRGELGRQAASAAAENRSIGVVAYADGAEWIFEPGSPRALEEALDGAGGPPLDPRPPGMASTATDLAAALDLALAAVGEGAPRDATVAIVGDGDRGRGAPGPWLERLVADGGVTIEAVAVPPPTRTDVALRELRLDPDPAAGQPLVAAIVVEVDPPRDEAQTVAVELTIADADGERLRRHSLEVAPGSAVARATVDLGPAVPGRVEVVGVASSGDGGSADPLPPNNSARAATRVAGRRSIGLVALDADRPAALAAFARDGGPPGVQVIPLSPAEVVAALPTLDAVVTFDVPLAELPAQALAQATRAGAGLLRVSGWNHRNAAQVPGGGPLEPLLALRAASPARPPRDVLLLVDGSGSMAGEPFEQVERAAVDLAGAAPAADRLLLRFFTGALKPTVVLEDEGGRGRAAVTEKLLATRVARGSTRLLASLEQYAAERAADPQRPTLALLLTDGREEGDPVQEERRRAELRATLRATGTELRALAVGPRADLSTLEPLVESPAHLIRVVDTDELATVLVRAVADEQLIHGPLSLDRAAADGTGLIDQVLAADAEPPTVGTLVRSELAPGATPIWSGPDAEPALAVIRVGAGRAAALATVPGPEWAPALGRTPAVLWPLIRWLASGGAPRWPRALVEGAELLVAGLPPGTPPTVGARVVDPVTADSLALTLLAEEPLARPGERRAAWPPAGWRESSVALQTVAGLELHLDVPGAPVLAVPRPLPAEFRGRRPFAVPAVSPAAEARGRGPSSAWRPTLLVGLVLASIAGIGRLLSLRGVKLPRAAGR